MNYLILEMIKKVSEIANDNADGQVIISGDKLGMSSAQTFLKEKNKNNSIKSKCAISLFINETSRRNYERKIEKINFKKPLFKIVNNVNANPDDNPENLKKLLI